jgi:uncharacterized membrane protein
VALAAFYVFTAVTVVGYATFGVNPGLLARYPWAAPFYAAAFRFFAIGHVAMAGVVFAIVLRAVAGWRWLPAFAAAYVISLGAELLGTTTGLPFGEYRYTDGLGVKLFGHVPALIPLSWFFMAVPSYAIAAALTRRRQGVVARVLLASLLLLCWDLALDPAMSYATAYWIWTEAGPYYGMPWVNLFGWYVTGVAIMAAFAALRSERWAARVPLRQMTGFYAANLALPIGMCLAAGLWTAAVTTLVVLGAIVGAALVAESMGTPAAARSQAPAKGAWQR